MASEGNAKSGRGGLVITVGVLTVIAAAGGALTGKMLAPHDMEAAAEGPGASSKPLLYPPGIELKELPAVVTNLANPSDAHVRLQVAMVYSKAAANDVTVLAAKIDDDIVAFLKTLSVAELQGPSGLQALREDLNERAAIRSEGRVREIIIETLVVQ